MSTHRPGIDDRQDDMSTPERGTEGLDDLGALPRTTTLSAWERFWRPFWLLPLVIVVAATAAGIFLPVLDRQLSGQVPFVFPGGPDGARSMLGTIAGAMISVTGLVFSITMVVIQLASSQFTPRVLGDFLASRVTQTTLGIFTASFTYALTVLRSVRGSSDGVDAFVPQLSVTVGFLLVLASVGMFLAFINHTTSSIQVGAIVSRLGRTTAGVVDRYYPAPDTPTAWTGREEDWEPPGLAVTLAAEDHGHVVEVHHRSLVEWAGEHDVVVELLVPVGGFVVEGMPALRVHGTTEVDDDERRLRDWVGVEQDRYHQQDPGLGLRKLVDIAERALSPGINDPTTATQVLDELHRVVRMLVQRPGLPQVVRVDGQVRLVHRPQEVDDLVDLALEEVLHYGSGSVQVPRRVLSLLEDVRTVSRREYLPRLDHWQRQAEATLRKVSAGA